MAISTYAELLSAMSTRFGDTGLDSQRDDFIALAEAWFNRKLRTAQMEERETLTLDSDGRAALASGYLATRSARYNGSPLRELRNVSLGGGNRLSPFDTSGEPIWFTITSISNTLKMQVWPIKDTAEIYHTYFEKIPALSASNTTNWLLTLAPDLYLHRCLAEGYTARQAFDKASGYAGHANEIAEELNQLDERARYGNAELVPDYVVA